MKNIIAILIVLTICGCGDDSQPPTVVSGRVTVKAAPLSGANITFEPVAGTKGPNASAQVWNGRFEISPDANLDGGEYRVRVSLIPAGLRATIPKDAGFELPPEDAVIAPQYDVKSSRTCRIETSQTNELEFEVEFIK